MNQRTEPCSHHAASTYDPNGRPVQQSTLVGNDLRDAVLRTQP
ncbi:hypothetical protein FHW64_003211 [Variovorax sp. Sphag1AA]|nr:hypothetical protein [Variovorax sp. Sphag1AA]